MASDRLVSRLRGEQGFISVVHEGHPGLMLTQLILHRMSLSAWLKESSLSDGKTPPLLSRTLNKFRVKTEKRKAPQPTIETAASLASLFRDDPVIR